MIVYRIVKEKYADELSGIGAATTGGRWNSKGIEVIYTSQSIALATLEVLVHLSKNLIPNDLMLLEIYIPDEIVPLTLKKEKLPNNWFVFPPLKITENIGNHFVQEQKSLILKVPSAIVKNEYNLLINPNHPDFKRVKVNYKEKFNFDPRLH